VRILVTGGSGYIGSHATHLFAMAGHEVANFDREPADQEVGQFFQGDTEDADTIFQAMRRFKPEAVAHLAGNSNMADSFENPSDYLLGVLRSAANIIDSMSANDCHRIVFSSSCSVYGDIRNATEESAKKPLSPYALSKSMVEDMLLFSYRSRSISVGIMRFFNVIGCRPDLNLFEEHHPESHILPNIARAAMFGESLRVFGGHLDTPDGTAIRDYVDVSDIVEGILLGLESLYSNSGADHQIWNLGGNLGISTLELVKKVELITGSYLNFELLPSRLGDPSEVSASNSKAMQELGWRPKRSIDDSIRSVLLGLGWKR
jgi:UDP-glucose 4-epimerase